MHPDLLQSCFLRTTANRMAKHLFRDRKQSWRGIAAVDHLHVVFQLPDKEPGHRHCPTALWGLGRMKIIDAIQIIIGLCDGDRPFIEVHILRRQRQQLPFPNTTPVEQLKANISKGFLRIIRAKRRYSSLFQMLTSLWVFGGFPTIFAGLFWRP